MHNYYGDILSRISDPVLWFDELAVPRFDPFEPGHVANIYASEVALVRIECQGCGHPFDVAFTAPRASAPLPSVEREDRRYPLLRDYIRAAQLHYGDPPNIECCIAGASMNSIPRTVLEYWVRPYILGEGLGLAWPRRGNLNTSDVGIRTVLNPDAMKFRREPDLQIDISPD
ncbi:MAG: hypothetical protein ABJF86_13635 [Tateyamaria sp.]|uniref:hypothetical protein n=1 Tax=Tateyamaria sp. TaxID=1929288 RepID=UPI00328CA078